MMIQPHQKATRAVSALSVAGGFLKTGIRGETRAFSVFPGCGVWGIVPTSGKPLTSLDKTGRGNRRFLGKETT
jgi:hypothetical protein